MSGVARNEERPDGARLWGVLAAILQMAILILFLLLLRGCGGGEDPTGAPGDTAGDFGCSGGASSLYAGLQVYWGDLHAHTVFSDDAATADPPPGPPEMALAYAADPARGNLDFVALTDHAETVTTEEWDATLAAIKAAETATFVPFAGFEYTNVSYDSGHGHKCVLLRDPDLVPAAPIGADQVADPSGLWQSLDASPGAGNYITVPHHPAKGIDYGANMSTDWASDCVSAARQPLVEIYSAHGNSEADGCEEPVDRFQEDASVDAALGLWLTTGDPGYKLGLLGSTDNHKSTPGSVAEIEENVAQREGEYTGGLAAVWAAALTRDALWSAIAGRASYATSGARIRLEFTAKAHDGFVPMGGTLALDVPRDVFLHVRAAGEPGVGIDRIEILKNGTLLAAAQTDHLDLTDPGVSANSYYRVKVYQSPTAVVRAAHCRNERAWSSPIWVELRR